MWGDLMRRYVLLYSMLSGLARCGLFKTSIELPPLQNGNNVNKSYKNYCEISEIAEIIVKHVINFHLT